MTVIFEAVRKVFKRNNTVEFDVENVSKALVSAHHYLHHGLLAGNFSDAGKPIPSLAVQTSDGKSSTKKNASD